MGQDYPQVESRAECECSHFTLAFLQEYCNTAFMAKAKKDLEPPTDNQADVFHGCISLQGRGVVTLPAALRRKLHLDEKGSQVEVVERADGVIELRPLLAIPADEAWFWTPEWQAKEREADEEIKAGRTSGPFSRAEARKHLEALMD
jgi:bifunctional DNA-binding transcriptional regulator/antitoxin component of YhaV-PrlF toxin-antitoxin module